MASAPIRQPRGPPSSTAAFSGGSSPGASGSATPTSSGPPAPDAESILRRNKTVSTSTANRASPPYDANVNLSHRRSFGSSGGSAYPAPPVPVPQVGKPSSGFVVASRYRDGPPQAPPMPMPMPVGVVGGALARRTSGRDFRPSAAVGGAEETLIETHAEAENDYSSGATERGTWGKGLARQSSLPSRRLVANGGVNPGLFTPAEPASSGSEDPAPPPRPPRRVYNPTTDQPSPTSPAPITTGSGHSRNSSLSLSMINAYGDQYGYDHPGSSPVVSTPGSAGHGSTGFPTAASASGAAGVSRTQSLRAHVQSQPPVDFSTLGRSASMRTPGELTYSRMHASPPPPPPFSAATPPRPSKSTLPMYGDESDIEGAEVRRHQSLTYGASARTRERLDRSQALLSLDQREDLRRRLASPGGASPTTASADGHGRGGHSRHLSLSMEDSPMGRSVWAPGAAGPGNDGWSSSTALQDALESLSITGRDPTGTVPSQPTLAHGGEEPAWVTNLVGMPGQPSPQAPQRPLGWDDRGASPYGNLPPHWAGAQLQPPLGVYQQQHLYAQAQALKIAAGLATGPISPLPGVSPGGMSPGYPMGPPGYLGAPFTPTYGSPGPAMGPPSAAPLSAQDLDVIELARQKGLNPATFNCRPPFARFFVIKSYTEDDVQKSLKHEIWSSTVLGNKRLDAAYRESHEKGPIYLFFSVNGSRHFCGVAEMTSHVDETQSSTVWAQDKWKGIFHLKWHFVRDISNLALRHIRLNNTPERKPITNTRDTTEVPYDAGCEVLQIFLDHQHKSKTSLLQDFAYYERLSANRAGPPSPSPAHSGHGSGHASGHASAHASGHATPTPPYGRA